MQFYDLFKELLGYIPSSFATVKDFLTAVLPVVLTVCALFTAFFGLKCAGLWCSVTLFFLGASVSSKYLLPNRNLDDIHFWVMFAVCLSIGVLMGVFSKYPARIQLVAGLFTLAYASLPSFITFFGETVAKLVGFIVALALAFLTVKYKYIIVIATTSFSGSFIFWNVMDDYFALQYKSFYAVIMGIAALAFQVYMNYDELKKTYKDVKMKVKKTEKGGEKAVHAVERELHIPVHLHGIKVLLWDFDNTLMDFYLAERNSLKSCFEKFELGECTDEMVSEYSAINDKYWKKLEQGEASKDEIMVGRFREFLGGHGLDSVTPEAFNAAYESGIADTVAYVENSKEIVKSLQGRVHQYIVTNGAYRVQERRLRESGFGDLTEGAFISDELKYEKPHVEFFNVVFRHIGDYKKDEILIVGDSLTSDMQGGNNAGIKCCWYNPQGKKRPHHPHIDTEIRSLSDIYKVLGIHDIKEQS